MDLRRENSQSSDVSTIGRRNGSSSSYTLLNYSDISVRNGSDNVSDDASNDIDNGGGEDGEEEEDADDDDDDPLQVRELATSFDNLMNKIQERTKELSEQVELNVSVQKTNYEVEIDKIQDNLERIKFLILKCDSLNTEFQKLEQINYIAKEFSNRLVIVEKEFKNHLKKRET